ncbi:PilZ domain-containing protein [Sneathiella sp.]|uniref:PilZ domain-containing protein n=1 Tax=Sneathiella sp. TaxID=1964365 RepID=UPI002FE2CD6C
MTESNIDNRRAHRRVMIARQGRVHHSAGAARACIMNISAGGAGLQMDMRLPDGSDITLEVGDIGLIPARVIRQLEDGIAVKFTFSAEKEQALIARIAALVARKRREQFRLVARAKSPESS